MIRRNILLLSIIFPIFTGFFPLVYAPPVSPPPGMVGWWTFDETSGPTANDIAGATNNLGTWMNGPTPVTGKVAGALSFDGVNDFVEVPDDPELNFGTGDFSMLPSP